MTINSINNNQTQASAAAAAEAYITTWLNSTIVPEKTDGPLSIDVDPAPLIPITHDQNSITCNGKCHCFL